MVSLSPLASENVIHVMVLTGSAVSSGFLLSVCTVAYFPSCVPLLLRSLLSPPRLPCISLASPALVFSLAYQLLSYSGASSPFSLTWAPVPVYLYLLPSSSFSPVFVELSGRFCFCVSVLFFSINSSTIDLFAVSCIWVHMLHSTCDGPGFYFLIYFFVNDIKPNLISILHY